MVLEVLPLFPVCSSGKSTIFPTRKYIVTASLPTSKPGLCGMDGTEADLSGSQMDSAHGPVWFLSPVWCPEPSWAVLTLCLLFPDELGSAGHLLLKDG